MLLVLAGCVSPGEFDQNILNRYQEAMAQRGPQPRLAPTGLGLLQPAEETGPKLKIEKAPGDVSLVRLSLDEAIMRALANNLDIQVISYNPEISRQQVIAAAAAFDYIVFGSVAWQRQEQAPTNRQFFGTTASEVSQYQVGIRQRTITGATWQIAPTLTRTIGGSAFTNDSIYQPALEVQLVQPLLRDAWPEFNLAQLRIAQLDYKNSVSQFRQRVEETINSVIENYWQLMQVRRALQIQEDLLARTIETRDRIRERLRIDATMVEMKQAEAAVETRRASLIRAAKNIGDVQDQLARLLADKQLNVLGRYEIVPTTPAGQVPLKIDNADQLMLSLVHNPQLEQARLAISAAEINVRVAQNQTLPRLDFQGTATLAGEDSELGESFSEAFGPELTSYSAALLFEYPLGNRAARAELARQRWIRLQAITTLQNTADQLAVVINERIRQIETTFQEMQAQRAAVAASAAQLQALNDIEQIRGRLTPEFLQVKLQAQESLANAQLNELQALTNYNTAFADLARVTGTILMQHGIDITKMPAAANEKPWPAVQDPATKPVQTTTIPIRPATTPVR